jgi:hypothetical protein
MTIANATKFDRNSGVAEWRDLRFLSPSSHLLKSRKYIHRALSQV